MNDNPKVSCALCTYGRFETVRQSITFWKYQDYDNKELVIFNTSHVPIELDESLSDYDIRIVNQQNETESGNSFSSLGKIREEALRKADGDIYICWDDDDMFLPWHISQGVTELIKCGRPAWMPAQSYWSQNGGNTFSYARNSMEASVLIDMKVLKKYGFDYKNGLEHLAWRVKMKNNGELSENDEVTPYESYAYVWGSSLAPHKTSGDVNNPNNFENHKSGSQDFGEGKKLTFVPDDQVEQLFINVYNSFTDRWYSEQIREKMNNHLKVAQIPSPVPVA